MRRIGLGALLASVLFIPLLISAGNPLLARIEALEAELDSQPVVIDANGVEVGWLLDGITPTVVLDFEGLPLFALHVADDELRGAVHALFFESTDCSGTPFIVNSSRASLSGDWNQPKLAFHLRDGTGRTWIQPVIEDGATRVFPSKLRSDNSESGSCNSVNEVGVFWSPAIPVPEMEGLFTPPFELVTRGDLLAQ